MTSQATRRRIEGDRSPRALPEPRSLTDQALLTEFARLTHHIGHPGSRERRDLIQAEVLRRMGGQR